MSMIAQSQWSGRIVARLLGPNVEADYEQLKKPVARLQPSTLCEGTGPLCHNPSTPQLYKKYEPAGEVVSHGGEGESSLRLEVYLFASDPSKAPLTVTLTRKATEEAANCLNRLGISLAKKVKTSVSKVGASKKMKHARVSATSTPFLGGGSDALGVAGMVNEQFWGLAADKPLTISVSVHDTIIPLTVEYNPPTVIGVSTFEKFASNIFPHIPLVVEVETLYATKAIVDWYAEEKVVCRDSHSYTPTMEDAGKKLAILITPIRPGHAGEGCQEAYQFQEKVSPELPENTVLQCRPEWQKQGHEDSSQLRVLSYNILADQNAFSGPNRVPFFPWVSAEVLARSRRMPLVVHEILAYQADVVCLQEVDEIVFESLLRPVMEYYNYQGYYSVKQTEGNREGSAMFWSLDRFQKASEEDCKTFGLGALVSGYASPMEEDSEWKDCTKSVKELLQKRPDLFDTIKTKLGHVVQIAHLRDMDGNPLLVANTHLFFHPIASHIRTLQLLAIAHQLTKEQGPTNKPFVFCGDLNTTLKHCASLLMNKHVPSNFRDHRDCLNSFQWEKNQADQTVQYDDDFPELHLPESFPDLATGYPDQPDFTHYIIGFAKTLDHVLFSSKTLSGELRPLHQAAMPTLEQVTRHQAMPSPCFPSDHISLVCDLEWVSHSSKD